MSTITIDLPQETYERLEERARKTGQTPEVLSRHLLETFLSPQTTPSPHTVRDALYGTGRARPLSEALRSKIIPGVTLNTARKILANTAGPSLSEMIEEQRGPRL